MLQLPPKITEVTTLEGKDWNVFKVILIYLNKLKKFNLNIKQNNALYFKNSTSYFRRGVGTKMKFDA